MKISGGVHRSRRLEHPVPEGVRPTPSRVREALFSVLGQDLSGLSVLDGFGGTGILAFEAASRGAGPVTIVERDRGRARMIEDNARALGIKAQVRVADAATVLANGSWDLVLLDPPYSEDPAHWARLGARATREVLVVEFAKGGEVPERIDALECARVRRYGGTCLAIYERVG